jgi:outer membrane receptor protein involved in Fe transport
MSVSKHQGPSRHILSLLVAAVATGSLSVASKSVAQQIEEITVMAQKREQNLQDVPMAVSAVSGKAMLEAGISDIKDLARQVPSLQVQSNVGPASLNYRIRRVGNLGNIPTFEPAVGVFQDGAFRNRPLFSAGDMFDVDRVEILRGPQSTLYGKNTTAGVVAVYTRKPSEEFTGNAELTAGQLEGALDAPMYRFVGGVSGPLTDTLRGSIGLSYASQDHTDESALAVSDADANDLERGAVRGQIAWDASDALSVRLIAGVMKQDDDQYLADTYIVPGSGADQAGRILRQFGLAESCASNDSTDREHCGFAAGTSDIDAREATLLVDYALANEWSITSITSWDWFKFRGTQDDVAQLASPLLRFHDTQEGESWQQELRLASAGGETVDWLTGVFWYQNEFDRGDGGKRSIFLDDTYSAHPVPSLLLQRLTGAPVPVPFALPGQQGLLDASQDTDYVGIFGQATWNITDRFAVTGGVRWQQEEKEASIDQALTVPGLSLLSARLAVPANSGDLDRDTDEVTWVITPQFALTDDINLFATVSHGFKSGGFNIGWGTTPITAPDGSSPREFDDEDIMHYEAGVKSTLLDGAMQLAFSAFYTEYEQYQDAAFISQQFSVGNAETAELKGAEAEGKVLFGEHVSADFGISYADFSYDEYSSGLCYPGRVPDNAATGTCDLSGEHPVNAPEWTTHLGLMYETDVSWGDVYARADWSWSDEYNTSFSADPRLVQDAYSWLNVRLGTRWDGYEVVAWVDNVTDEDVVNLDAQLNLLTADPSYQTFMQAPRSYGVTARINF